MIVSLDRYMQAVSAVPTIRLEGIVSKVVGTIIEGQGPAVPVGGVCKILPSRDIDPIMAEAVGFRDGMLSEPTPHFYLIRGCLRNIDTVSRKIEGMLHCGNGE